MLKTLLIANRGEIAIRIARSAAEMGIATVAIYSEDDAQSLHTRKADEALGLKGSGVAAYLDAAQIVAVAKEAGCDAIHPGYGFLSENADFARRCAEAGIIFVGPSPETLDLFGDKTKARALADKAKSPCCAARKAISRWKRRRSFWPGGPIMLKALAGGGGRGMRVVRDRAELEQAFERCRSEAQAAFGNGALYAEEFFERARHIEVQIVGDGTGAVSHLWDRECSLQRQRQKLIESAPALGLPEKSHQRLLDAAIALGKASHYKNLGTIEFLVDAGGSDRFAFIEANPRLQVEHTVTEEVTGLDLVRIQLDIAGGKSLRDLHLEQKDVPSPRGVALQARVNLETMNADGSSRPAGGTLTIYEPPSGRGVRVDGFGYAGYRTSARYDSLLAKLIVHTPGDSLAEAANKAWRALGEFKIEGAPTNIPFLQTLLRHPGIAHQHTRFVEENIVSLLGEAAHPKFFFEPARASSSRAGVKSRQCRSSRRSRAWQARGRRRIRTRVIGYPGRHHRTARAPAGHHHQPHREARRQSARGPAHPRHGSDEDGACDRGECRRRGARAGRRGRRYRVRGCAAGLYRRRRSGRRA